MGKHEEEERAAPGHGQDLAHQRYLVVGLLSLDEPERY